MNGSYYLVAIDGRGGSGKTVLAEYLATLLPDFTFINGDDYFEPTPDAVAWGDFNNTRFKKDVIQPLSEGKNTILYKPYDWHFEPHISNRLITITKGICVERSFSFAFNLDWDLRIWVETPKAVALKRGQEREQMPVEQVTKVWKEVWQPREDEYIKKLKPQEMADIVVDGTKPFEEQITLA